MKKRLVWLLKIIIVDADVKILLKKVKKAVLVIAEAIGLTVVFYLWILFVKACLGVVIEEYLKFLWIGWFVLISIIVRKKLIKIFKK